MSAPGRYSRQELFAGIGRDGQARIREARVAVVGCGALGSALAEMMVRAGAGAVTVIDRDYVEESNLQRQSLFDESDVARGMPKAAAAAGRLSALNSDVAVRGVVADLAVDNAGELLAGHTLVLDGTDNFETRFLVNDVCVRERFQNRASESAGQHVFFHGDDQVHPARGFQYGPGVKRLDRVDVQHARGDAVTRQFVGRLQGPVGHDAGGDEQHGATRACQDSLSNPRLIRVACDDRIASLGEADVDRPGPV